MTPMFYYKLKVTFKKKLQAVASPQKLQQHNKKGKKNYHIQMAKIIIIIIISVKPQSLNNSK